MHRREVFRGFRRLVAIAQRDPTGMPMRIGERPAVALYMGCGEQVGILKIPHIEGMAHLT